MRWRVSRVVATWNWLFRGLVALARTLTLVGVSMYLTRRDGKGVVGAERD
jgi:hypothetical protein